MKVLFIFLLLSNTAAVSQGPAPKRLQAASVPIIRSAHCLKRIPFSQGQISNWLVKNRSATTFNKTIHGISFLGEPAEELQAFDALTTTVDHFGAKDAKRQKTYRSDCTKVDCAVKEIFGATTGPQLLFMRLRFGINGSHLIRQETSAWKASELDVLLLALSDFPDGTLSGIENHGLVHFKRGYLLRGDEDTIANAKMQVFDLWGQEPPELQRAAINHELAHVLALSTKVDTSVDWLGLSDWKKGKALAPETIVSRYGLTNPQEDFAESVLAYRYSPSVLKKLSPKKYDLIREVVFDHVEFVREEACAAPVRLEAKLRAQLQEFGKTWEPNSQELSQISNSCTNVAVQELAKHGAIRLREGIFSSCYQAGLAQVLKTSTNEELAKIKHVKFLKSTLKKLGAVEVSAAKQRRILAAAMQRHGKVLRSELYRSFRKNYNFKKECPSKMTEFAYLDYDVKILDLARSAQAKNIGTFTLKACRQIRENGSLRRMMGLDFSDEEISLQVEAMVKE